MKKKINTQTKCENFLIFHKNESTKKSQSLFASLHFTSLMYITFSKLEYMMCYGMVWCVYVLLISTLILYLYLYIPIIHSLYLFTCSSSKCNQTKSKYVFNTHTFESMMIFKYTKHIFIHQNEKSSLLVKYVCFAYFQNLRFFLFHRSNLLIS